MKKTFFAVSISFLAMCVLFSACTADIVNTGSSLADSDVESVASVDNDSANSVDVSVEVSGEQSTEISEDISGEESAEKEPSYTAGDYIYTLTNNVAKLVGYTGDANELELPNEIEGHTLTAIESGAFAGNTKLKKLTVGDSVVNIANGALSGCTALEYLSLGSSVAVFNAFDLEEALLLEKIDVANANTVFASENGVLYNGNRTALLFCPRALEAESLKLPIGLLKIEENAFAECKAVKKVELPEGCALSAFSFFHCTALEEVVLSGGQEAIPEKCFFGCVMLKEISVPEGVLEIGRLAFFGCVALSKASLPSTVTSIGEDVFKCCSALKSISVKGEYATAWYNETGKGFIS